MNLIKHIYINVPFCKNICSFCNFYKNRSSLLEESFTQKNPYHQFLSSELSLYTSLISHDIRSIYVGGGSPLEVSSWQIAPFLKILSQNFCLLKSENTVESNPDIQEISQEYIDFFNRISIGVQSFSLNSRTLLGRTHIPSESFFKMVKKMFTKISLDMIWDIPGQSQKELTQDINEVITRNFEHISWYALENPPKEVADGSLKRYKIIQKELLKNGLSMYEISNFSKKGQESIHNLAYWNHDYYVGLGPGACGFIPTSLGPLRYTNEFSIPKYCKLIQEGKFPYVQSEILQKKEICNEKILLGLRLERGVNLQELREEYDLDLLSVKSEIIQRYCNFIRNSNREYMSLTLEGKLFYNTICSELLL